MRIAENDWCAHVDQFIDEEQTALEHLLVDEDGASRLRNDHQRYADQVWRESGPGCVRYGEDRAVNKAFDRIAFLCRNINVVTAELHLYPEAPEYFRYNAEHFDAAVANGKLRLRHG